MSVNIHDAMDQITAILQAELPNLDPATMELLTEAIGDNIETMRADFLVQMVAAISANNTNALNLNSVLANQSPCCQASIFISQTDFFQAVIEPSGPGGPLIPAPDPFTELELSEDEKLSRRCVIATLMVDEIREMLDKANDLQIDEILNIEFAILFGIWLALLTELILTVPILVEVLAKTTIILPTIVHHIIDSIGSLEFSTIVVAIDARRDDLICALFDGVDGAGARGDFLAILAAEGVTVTNQTMVALILADHYVNSMYYFTSPTNEAFYQAGGAPGDCSGCSVSCANRTPQLLISDNGTTRVVQAVQNTFDNSWYATSYMDATPEYQFCGDTFEITDITLTAGAFNPQAPAGIRLHDSQNFPNFTGNRYHGNIIPIIPITGVRLVVFKSSTAFTMAFDYVVE